MGPYHGNLVNHRSDSASLCCAFIMVLCVMRKFFGLFSFFKMPIQIALGLYLAFLMFVGTVAVIEHYVEDFDHCEDLMIQIESDQFLSKLRKL